MRSFSNIMPNFAGKIMYNMLRGEQVEKSENQNRAAKVQEEEGLRNCKELVDRLVKQGIRL